MPKSTWEQSSARRWTMQGVMALVFGATLGLAVWVGQGRATSTRVELGDAVVEGGVSVRLPRGWAVAHETNAESGRFLLAVEKGRSSGARTIGVYRHRPERLMSPMEYLAESGVVDTNKPELPKELDAKLSLPETKIEWSACRVGGFPGVEWRVSSPAVQTQFEIPELRALIAGMMPKQIIGATVLPSRRAVAVKLSGTGPIEPGDVRMLREVLDSLTLLDEKAPAPADATTQTVDLLPAGAVDGAAPVARVRVPVGFAPAPASRNGLWTTRVLVGVSTPLAPYGGVTRDASERQWEMIELTPATLGPGADARQVSGILSLHDLAWSNAGVTDESPVGDGRRVWRVEPVKSDTDFASARRAYVVTEADGRAVVVVLYLPRDSAGRLEPLWKAMLPTITFPGISDVEMMARHGQIEARRVNERPPGTATQGSPRWWLRTREGEERGWASESVDATGRAGKSDGRSLEWNGHVSKVQTIWTREGANYLAARSLADMDVPSKLTLRSNPEAPAVRVSRATSRLLQQVIVEPGRLVTSLKGDTTVRVEQAPPGDFVPAPLLARALARAEALPMSIQTDARPGREELAVQSLVRLNVRRDAGTQDRSLIVELDGTGEAQRWTFDSVTGALKQIELADGTKLAPGTEAQVRFLANRDQRMSP